MLPRGLLREYSGALSIVARVMDVICILLGSVFAFMWRFEQLVMPQHYQIALLIGLLLTVIVFNSSGIYKSWRGQDWWHQARVVTVAWASVVIVLVIFAFMTKTSITFSRQWMGVWAISGWAFLLLFRFSLNHLLRVMRASGFNQKRIVIVGAGDLGRKVVNNIKLSEWTGLNVVGFFDDKSALHGKSFVGVKVCGSGEKLNQLLERGRVDEGLLGFPPRGGGGVREILDGLGRVEYLHGNFRQPD